MNATVAMSVQCKLHSNILMYIKQKIDAAYMFVKTRFFQQAEKIILNHFLSVCVKGLKVKLKFVEMVSRMLLL